MLSPKQALEGNARLKVAALSVLMTQIDEALEKYPFRVTVDCYNGFSMLTRDDLTPLFEEYRKWGWKVDKANLVKVVFCPDPMESHRIHKPEMEQQSHEVRSI